MRQQEREETGSSSAVSSNKFLNRGRNVHSHFIDIWRTWVHEATKHAQVAGSVPASVPLPQKSVIYSYDLDDRGFQGKQVKGQRSGRMTLGKGQAVGFLGATTEPPTTTERWDRPLSRPEQIFFFNTNCAWGGPKRCHLLGRCDYKAWVLTED